MKLTVKTKLSSYDILIQRGGLSELGKNISLDRKVLIVTDEGVPSEYAKTLLSQCKNGVIAEIKQGENSKSIDNFALLCSKMRENSFTRSDLVIAVGGGVVGDLAGFAAAGYMRGIDFVNVPTTTLSQIDSSIGGKTGVNLDGVKNIVGAFHQPRLVLVDSALTETLEKRHIANGLVEAVKAGLIYDSELFELFFKETLDIDEIVFRSLKVKKAVVEEDEDEKGLRRILNFGHTIGHAIESACGFDDREVGLLHGEAVAYGMIPMIDDEGLKARVCEVFKRLGIPKLPDFDKEYAFSLLSNDKKSQGEEIYTVRVKEAGKSYCVKEKKTTINEYLQEIPNEFC